MSVQKGLGLLLAVFALSFLVACGGGGGSVANTVAPPSGGFSVSNLNGTYVFSTSGFDSSNGFLSMAGSLVADGQGHITSGTVDLTGQDFGVSSPAAQPISSGSYTMGVDGRGIIKFSVPTASGTVPVGLDVVLTSNSHGLVTEYDSNGSGSGTIDAQASSIAQSGLTGLTFALSGVGSTSSLSTVGSVTLSAAGAVTAGFEDFNNGGAPTPAAAVATTSSVTLGSGTTPGTAILSSSFGTLTFDVYAIDTTHVKLIESDGQFYLVGDGFTPGTSLPASATLAYTMGGSIQSSSQPISVGGLMTLDANSQVSSGIEDFNDGVNVNSDTSFAGGLAALSGGRSTLTLSGFVNSSPNDVTGTFTFAAYPFTSNGVSGFELLEMDGLGVTTGVAYVQTGTTLAASSGYGLNLSAINLGSGSGAFEEDDIAEFSTTSTGFSGAVDFNDQGQTTTQQPLTGAYQTGGTGRYLITTSNAFNLNAYAVNSSTFLILEVDSGQSGTGIFELQSSSGSPGSEPGISVLRGAAHPHAAAQHGK